MILLFHTLQRQSNSSPEKFLLSAIGFFGDSQLPRKTNEHAAYGGPRGWCYPLRPRRLPYRYFFSTHPRMFKVTFGSEEGTVLAGSMNSSFSSPD
jgi:hypothetical protein